MLKILPDYILNNTQGHLMCFDLNPYEVTAFVC